MVKALLLKTDGTCDVVNVREYEGDFNDDLREIIGSKDVYLFPLEFDEESSRTLFMYSDVCNDGIPEYRFPKKDLNAFISRYSKATIYGNVVVFLSEPIDDGNERRLDLDITPEELGVILESISVKDYLDDDFGYMFKPVWKPEPKTLLSAKAKEIPEESLANPREYEFTTFPRDEVIFDPVLRTRLLDILSKIGITHLSEFFEVPW